MLNRVNVYFLTIVLNWPWKPLNEWRPIGSLRLRLRIEDRGVLPPWHTFANGPSTVSLGLQQRPDIAVTRLLLLRDYVRPVWGLSLSLSWWSAVRRPGFGPHSLCQGLGRLRPPQSSWGPHRVTWPTNTRQRTQTARLTFSSEEWEIMKSLSGQILTGFGGNLHPLDKYITSLNHPIQR